MTARSFLSRIPAHRRLSGTSLADQSRSRSLREQIRSLSARIEFYEERIDALEVRAPRPGAALVPDAEDLTGRAIIVKLLEAVRAEPRITVRSGLVAVDLLNLPDRSANRLERLVEAAVPVGDLDGGQRVGLPFQRKPAAVEV